MRALIALVALAVLLPTFAGCLGGPSSPAPASASLARSSAGANATGDARALGNGTMSMNMSMNMSPGATPHKHDYWRGRERVKVIDSDFAITLQSRNAFFTVFAEGRPALGAATISLPDGQIVYEGTGRLEFTATWTDPTITGLVLRYRATANPTPSAPIALTSGTVVPIPVTAEMTDDPHASSSLWRFTLEASGPGGAGVAQGTVHVLAEIVKMRDIETFPAHPDLFGGGALVKILDKDMTVDSDSATAFLQAFSSHTFDPPGFPPDHPVPPDAKSVMVQLVVKSVTTNNPLEDTSKVTLSYKTARSAFNYKQANVSKSDGKTFLYEMPVGQGDGDSYYAKTSQWRFDPVLEDNVEGQRVDCFFGDCFTWSMSVHVTAYAFKTVGTLDLFPKG